MERELETPQTAPELLTPDSAESWPQAVRIEPFSMADRPETALSREGFFARAEHLQAIHRMAVIQNRFFHPALNGGQITYVRHMLARAVRANASRET